MQNRYERNILLLGEVGQAKFAAAKVLVVGAGGLGAPVLYYLAGAGIGHIGICDGDVVSASNLNRQILYTGADLQKPKAACAAAQLKKFNPAIEYTLYPHFLTGENAVNICSGYDIVMDCLDNLPARYLLNDACLALNIPFVHGGISEYYGQQLTVIPHKTPCFRCLCPEEQVDALPATAGTLGATPGIIGSMMAMEALKYILDKPVNTGSILYFDGIAMETEKVALAINPSCKCQR